MRKFKALRINRVFCSMNTKIYASNRLQEYLEQLMTAAAALLLVLPLGVQAGGVVTTCTEAALRAAMAGGGTVTFACDGTITVASTITNTANTVVDASGRTVTISGGTIVQVFYVATNTSLTLVKLTVSSGLAGDPYNYLPTRSGGGVVNDGGTLNLFGVDFQANVALSGGAILNQDGVLTATGCVFSNNQARAFGGPGWSDQARGGALLNLSGQVTLQNCVFTENQAFGAITFEYPVPGNDGYGGAVENRGTLNVSGCTFVKNVARGGDGADAPYNVLAALAGSSGGCGEGGAIYNLGVLAINSSTFASNAVSGGRGGNGDDGIGLPDSPAGPGGAGGNAGFANGGAVCGSGTAVNSTFAWNTATGGAGGRGGAGGSAYHLATPGAGGPGGSGGYAFGGVCGGLQMASCTVAFNSATSGSGGDGGSGGEGNGVPSGPDGPAGADGAAGGGITQGTCLNTLLATNSPGGNNFGTVVDLGYNISSDNTCTFTNTGSLNSTDPKLGPLANNGGPTLTLALLPGSPAIDAGNTSLAPSTDQRGFPRPAGMAADIGAFEYGSVMPTIAISRSGATGLNILGTGNAGQFCRLLSSPDLRNWAPIATNQTESDGTVLFYDTCAPGSTCRFYRLVMP
jgi:hypothetical protein